MSTPPRTSSAAAFWVGVGLVVAGVAGIVWRSGVTFGPDEVRRYVLLNEVFQVASLLGVALIAVSLVLRRLEPAAGAEQPAKAVSVGEPAGY